MFAVQLFLALKQYFTLQCVEMLLVFLCLCQLIAECEQVKVERETELINEQILMAMSEMGFDRERTLQVKYTHTLLHSDELFWNIHVVVFLLSVSAH